MVHVPGFAEGAEPTSGLLLHPLAMRLILGIDPDSHLQGGWQSAPDRLNTDKAGEAFSFTRQGFGQLSAASC